MSCFRDFTTNSLLARKTLPRLWVPPRRKLEQTYLTPVGQGPRQVFRDPTWEGWEHADWEGAGDHWDHQEGAHFLPVLPGANLPERSSLGNKLLTQGQQPMGSQHDPEIGHPSL